MIHTDTGEVVTCDGALRVGPSLAKGDFLESAHGRQSTVDIVNVPWCSYRLELPAGSLLPDRAVVILRFFRQRLRYVQIVDVDERFGTSWHDWSLEKEMLRKRLHEQWLDDNDAAEGDYPWGRIVSAYDERSGGSYILLRYGRPEASAEEGAAC